MKILHCITKLKDGGAQTQLNILINNEKNFKHVVVSYDDHEDDQNTYYKLIQRSNILKKWKNFRRILKIEKPDIIHIWLPAVFHVYFLPSLFLPAKRILGIRNVYKLENLKRYIHLFIYFFCKNVVSNTHIGDQRGWFKKVYKNKNYFFIPNAIKFEINPPKKVNVVNNNNTKQLLFVGRLVNQKNIINLLDALSLIKKLNWELKIIGNGQLRQKLQEKIVNLKLTHKVSIFEFNNKIEEYYKKADALILPSFTEGLPNVVLEAASFQNIILLSDIPQHKRWFTHNQNALLFNPHDKNEIKTSIIRFLDMDVNERFNYNLNAYDVIKNLSKEAYIEKYTQMYYKINNL